MKMFYIGTAVVLNLAAVKAQMTPYKGMYSYFGSCRGEEWGSTDACLALGRKNVQCCRFEISTNPNMKS